MTKGATCGTLLGAGDVLCQWVTIKQRRQHASASQRSECDGGLWDRGRMARMFWWGALCNGPAGHIWYRGLDHVVRASGVRGVITKVVADQLVFTPPLTLLYFMWQHSLSHMDLTLQPAMQYALENLWPTLQVNFVYWSAVHVITFACVPLSYRVAFVAVKNFFWGAYLSFATATSEEPAPANGRTRRMNSRLARTATH